MSQTAWNFDPTHSSIEFKVRHMMISNVKGHFDKFNVDLKADDDLTAAHAKAEIDWTSINTGNADRDGHLKSPDFVDTANHPHATFEAKEVKKVDDHHYKVLGHLAINGLTHEEEFDLEYKGQVSDPYGLTRRGFTVTGNLDREKYGLTWNALLEAGGAVVGKEVHVTGEFQFTKAQ